MRLPPPALDLLLLASRCVRVRVPFSLHLHPLCACRSACWRTGAACAQSNQPGDWRACQSMRRRTSTSPCCLLRGSSTGG